MSNLASGWSTFYARDLLEGENPSFQVVTSVVAASGALLTYDFLCTLDVEINHVWSRPMSISTMIFFLNRYPPFIDTFLSLALKLANSTPEKCHIGFRVVTWFIVFGIMLAEIILMLRTYAIWGCRRWVQIGFVVLGLVTFVPAIALTQIELNSLIYIQAPYPGCKLTHSSPIIIVAYILLVLCETIIAVMLGIKAFQHLQHSHSDWVSSLYRDGLLFYACLLMISLANIFTPLINSHLANMLATPQRVFHSILCNRILFLIFRNQTEQRSPSHLTSAFDEEMSTRLAFTDHTYPPRQLLSGSSEGSSRLY